MNLARSLLVACERFPEQEAFPGIRYRELLPRIQRIAGGLAVEPGERVALILDNRVETALLYWAAQWAGAVAVPLSLAPLPRGARLLPRRLRRHANADRWRSAARRPSARRSARPGRAGAVADPLHLGHDRSAEGRPALAPSRPRRGALAGHPPRLRHRRADARGHASLPHDGHPHAARHAPGRRLLRPAGALRPVRGARPSRRTAHQRAVPRADPVLRPARAARPDARRHLVGARARVRRGGDDVDPRRALLPGARPGDLRQPLRVDRDLHVHDRDRSAAQAGLRRTSRGEHAHAV